MKRIKDNKNGFTLVEIMVVVAIMGMLLTIITIRLIGYQQKAESDTTKAKLSNLVRQVDMYKLTNKKYPESLEDLKKNIPGTSEPFVRPVDLLDSWDNPFVYRRQGSKFEILSHGADGAPGGDGENTDISSTDLEKGKPE
jgi:general secretion pathway protein G